MYELYMYIHMNFLHLHLIVPRILIFKNILLHAHTKQAFCATVHFIKTFIHGYLYVRTSLISSGYITTINLV